MGGVIKTLLGMVILVAILVFGYWLYATYTSATADDRIWAQINEKMPDQLRQWSCEQMNARLAEAEAPDSCADVWQTAVTPQGQAPALETSANQPVDATVQPRVDTQPAASPEPVENAQPSAEGVPANN